MLEEKITELGLETLKLGGQMVLNLPNGERLTVHRTTKKVVIYKAAQGVYNKRTVRAGVEGQA